MSPTRPFFFQPAMISIAGFLWTGPGHGALDRVFSQVRKVENTSGVRVRQSAVGGRLLFPRAETEAETLEQHEYASDQRQNAQDLGGNVETEQNVQTDEEKINGECDIGHVDKILQRGEIHNPWYLKDATFPWSRRRSMSFPRGAGWTRLLGNDQVVFAGSVPFIAAPKSVA